jgi:ketosteroid isomerase-like protein
MALSRAMTRTRLLASLSSSAVILMATSACATSTVSPQDEIIRTAPVEGNSGVTTASPRVSHLPAYSTAQTFDAVSNFLDEAAALWSEGDVEALMATYVDDEPLLVFLGDTPLKGPDAVKAALDARATDGGLGAMSYEWFETMQFDANTVVASGRVVMARKGEIHRGLFTRVLRRTPDGWRIVHDQLAWGPNG